MTIEKISAIALIALVAVMLLRQHKPEWTFFIRIAATVAIFVLIGGMFHDVKEYMESLGSAVEKSHLETIMKALVIALLTHISASMCRDCGEGSMASFVEMAGKIEILILSFPLITDILKTAINLLPS